MSDDVYMPDPFIDELEALLKRIEDEGKENLCLCPLNDLMARGCTCGAIIIERKLRRKDDG